MKLFLQKFINIMPVLLFHKEKVKMMLLRISFSHMKLDCIIFESKLIFTMMICICY